MGKRRGWQSALRSRLAVALCLRPGCTQQGKGRAGRAGAWPQTLAGGSLPALGVSQASPQ